MIQKGETAPAFTASLATADGELETFSLSGALSEAPLVIAFFPAAFSGTCTQEMAAFEAELERFEAAGASLYGVSVDLPWALAEFAAQQDLSFDLIGDTNREAVTAYGVTLAFDDLSLDRVADRAVVVIDADRVVTYRWLADDPGEEPPYDDVLRAVETTTAAE